MKRIGLTGNIGTGKSTIARIFGILGVQVYHADLQARQMLESYKIIDLGDITAARGTEQVLPIWVRLMGKLGTPMFNFSIVS